MENEKMFTTGDFASLCNTTRDTLYHYDEIGLLKPERVEPNGYRLYSLTQFKEFIEGLSCCGCGSNGEGGCCS